MDYFNLRLETVKIPADAEERAKAGRLNWQYAAAKGILLEVRYAKDGIPAYCGWGGDNTEGLKYILIINHADNALATLTKAVKKIAKNWQDYILDEIEQNPKLAVSETTFTCDSAVGLFVWTTDKNEFPLLLSECSKAIVKLTPNPSKRFDTAAGKALADEKGLATFARLIRENAAAMSKYQNLYAGVDAIMGKWPTEKLIPTLAALVCVDGFADLLKELMVRHDADHYFQNNPQDHETLFCLVQENVSEAYSDNWQGGLISKEFILSYVRLLSGALDTLGFGVYPKGVETIIRLFENDSAEGITIETYQTAGDYHAEDYGYFDGIENEEYYNKLWHEIALWVPDVGGDPYLENFE